ncbi:hypothetical protein D6C95_10138, partial [Aureobasidium pullulans]
AAATGNQQILELLIQNDADFNSECKEYGNALHVAMEKGHTSGVNTLVKLGLSAQFQSQSRWRNFLHQAGRPSNDPVREAFGSDDTQMVETFLGRFRDVRYHEDALRIASGVGKHSIVLALLDFGANLDACSLALPSAAHGGYKEIVRLLLDRGANINAFCEGSDSMGTALQVASGDGYETMVRMLLDRGADVNVLGGCYGTALQAASTIGHEAIVRMLLDGGADVNVLGGHYGTALQTASENGHEAIVRILLDAGADINASSGIMRTALYAASENGHEAIVRFLLDHDADVNHLRSWKPLHAALCRGYAEIVSLLLEYGADMNVSSESYPNALAAAEACRDEQKRAACKQILLDEKRKRQPEPYLVWVDGIAYFNCQ